MNLDSFYKNSYCDFANDDKELRKYFRSRSVNSCKNADRVHLDNIYSIFNNNNKKEESEVKTDRMDKRRLLTSSGIKNDFYF